MLKNVGGLDRGLRLIAGLIIFWFGWKYRSWWGLLGIIPFATGLISWCPAYLPFGLSTRRKGNAAKS